LPVFSADFAQAGLAGAPGGRSDPRTEQKTRIEKARGRFPGAGF
jgi:hypothetical protein